MELPEQKFLLPLIHHQPHQNQSSFCILTGKAPAHGASALLYASKVASIINSSIQPLHMMGVLKDLEKMFGAESLIWAQHTINKGFSALERLLDDFAGKYATGEEVYMADVFLAPPITLATQRFNTDMSKFPTLSRLYETYKALPEYQASSPARQPDAKAVKPT